jgi:hypothetical protein
MLLLIGACPCSNLHKAEENWRFSQAGRTVTLMVAILSAIVSIFEFRVRSRAPLELELIALRHQVTVLRRQHPGRPQLSSLDRVLWVWLYRVWPQVIDAMVLVKPTTVVQWHRKASAFIGGGDRAVRDDLRSAQKSVI